MTANSDGGSFLFVNKNASNLRSKAHAGAVNAHVHADARAKRLRATLTAPPSHPTAPFGILHQSLHSWQVEGTPALLSTDSWEGSTASDFGGLKLTDDRTTSLSSRKSSSVSSEDSPPNTGLDTHAPNPASLQRPATRHLVSDVSDVHLARQRPTSQKNPLRTTSTNSEGCRDCPKYLDTDSTELVLSKPVTVSALDPFCVMPIETSPEEQTLAQYYLQMMPSIVYGLRPDAIFCPVRDVSFPNVSNDPLVLLWVMTLAEAHLAAQGRPVTHSESVLRRKAKTYRIMKQRLNDPAEQLSEQTFGGMIAAANVDARLSGSRIGNIHLRGLNQLLHKRGGLKTLYSDKKLAGGPLLFVWCHHLSDGAGGILNMRDLKTYKQKFLTTLDSMDAWNTARRQESIKAEANIKTAPILNNDYLTKYYALSRTRAFSSPSVLRPLLDPNYPCGTQLEKTCHFSNFFTLNLTLWAFREDPALTAAFLDRIMQHIERGGNIDPVTKRTSLTQNALIWIIPRARMEVNTQDEDAEHQQEVWLSWMVIYALKIFALLGDERRTKLVKVLSNWLLGDGNQDLERISGNDIAEMDAEITLRWLNAPG